MHTLRLTADPANLDHPETREAIAKAARLLRDGGTVAFPTETVYGLGANALDPTAVARIFAAKDRPGWDPLIVHISDRGMLTQVAKDLPGAAERLMQRFWPGPLTLLLPRHPQVPDAVTAGRPLVGVRMPAHPVAAALLRAAGIPVAAPSANRFGRSSPTTAAHVAEDLDGRIYAILDAGETTLGLESTVVDPGQEPCLVYRPGMIPLEEIRAVSPGAVLFADLPAGPQAPPEALPSPGVGLRHYAPRARLVLVESERDFAQAVRDQSRLAGRVGLMLPEEFISPDFPVSGFAAPVFSDPVANPLLYRWGKWTDPQELAHRLFAGLRWLDAAGADVILCPLPPPGGIGTALRDRLRKAARS
jgi:L-threonylcarbamoyladenylate synthase